MRALRSAPPQHEQSSAQKDRTPTSRLPTKSSSSYASDTSTRPPQHVAQMGKRSSRSIPQERATRDATRTIPTIAPSRSNVTTSRTAGPTQSSLGTASAPLTHHNTVLLPPPSSGTPSLVSSAASASTFDSPRSQSLRRKPLTIEQYKRGQTPDNDQYQPSAPTKAPIPDVHFDDTVFGIAIPHAHAKSDENIPPPGAELIARSLTRDVTPPVPRYAQSTTPSTRYTDSPFSHAPTPSSASSYSPGIVAVATKAVTSPRTRPPSPTRSRPPLSGRPSENNSRLGLLPVRESSTSSSTSTVKQLENRSTQPKKTASVKSAAATPKTAVAAAPPPSRGKLVKEQPKQAAPATNSKTRNSIPPELAHLNVDPPNAPPPHKSPPPARPSRDGTPSLTEINVASPVVQSDLPRLYTSYHKRTPSQETPSNTTSPDLKTRFGFSSKSSSRNASPKIDSAISPPTTATTFSRAPPPASVTDSSTSSKQRLARKDSPAVGQSPSKSSRFGFFSRKSKPDTTKPTEKPVRPPSKGPAAGTGHEGYGRFSMQRRSSSTSSSAGYRSPSTESSTTSSRHRQSSSGRASISGKDGYELDEFLRERLNPVVLRGSGSGSTISNAVSSSESQIPSGPTSSHNSSLFSMPAPQLLPSAMDNATGVSPEKPRRTHRAPSDSSEDEVFVRYPLMSHAGPRLAAGPMRRKPTKPPPQHSPAGATGSESAVSLPDQGQIPRLQDSREGGSQRPEVARNESQRKIHRKWNFFQRAQAVPVDKGKQRAVTSPSKTNGSVVGPRKQDVTHFATIDSIDSIGLEEVERIVLEPETSPEDSMSESYGPSRNKAYEQRHRSSRSFPSLSENSDDSEFSVRPRPPRILIRHDSEDSSKLLFAERTVPHQSPTMVDIGGSPGLTSPPVMEPKAISTELRPLLPPPPQDQLHTPDMAQAPFSMTENGENVSPPRPPRLSPVGRIPKVVSKRDRDRKLSDSSFSRPFARGQPKPTVKPPGLLYNQIRELASPTDSNSQPVSSTSTNSNGMSNDDTIRRADLAKRESLSTYDGGEFFSFLARNDSNVSYSSSSGNNSVLAILAAQPPQEDDIWHEYNDLLDAVLPDKHVHSVASSFGEPFQYDSALYDSPDLDSQAYYLEAVSTGLTYPPMTTATSAMPSVLSVPQQIARFMQPSYSPLNTPQILSGVFSDYGNRSTMSTVAADRLSGQEIENSSVPRSLQAPIPPPAKSGPPRTSIPEPTSRSSLPRSSRSSGGAPSLPRNSRSSLPSARGSVASSSRHSRGSLHSRSASLPEANARNSQASLTSSVRYNRDTQLLDIAEVDGDEQAAAANLRFGALMTSKWLSFGRVLFSPAHNEMRLADEARVLIIDGLGSDWSYYVAISYPMATIYNLGPAPVPGVSDWPGTKERPPSNHRHINHAAISAAFPFPKGFFTAVVFRFPLVTTDQAYQACIFECKRVLRPGGFLEVAALDIDMMNMGNRARKELRGLKTRLQQRRQDISLRNLSDVLVGFIGRRGFEDVQRCIVGVPAAGHIPKSQDADSASAGSNSGSGSKPSTRRHEERAQSREFSFADLLEDARANELGQVPPRNNDKDENITKMVAKVGRWWFAACYEKALLQSSRAGKSIWNDAALLRECEKQGTSFRLLICYAQKPAQTRRRTVSV